MRVSYHWLAEYVDLTGISPEELAERLTLSGIAVDAVERRNKGVKNVVVGHVIRREPHPDADRLSVCRVDVGRGEELQIVCGARNVAQGQKVPVALAGAELPGNVKIKRTTLRGVESQGMICSAKELGLEDRLLPKEVQEGILVLPSDLEVGQDVVPILGLDDFVLELDLTPNRADCLSMIGVAHEVAAILGREVRLPERPAFDDEREPNPWKITIEAEEHCYDYAARIIRGLKIGPSPLWLQNRLLAAGIRPINNVVDVTNYVMLEYGQPLHAFDAAKVGSREILVRLARPGETIVTLDGVKRKLDEEMLLITNGKTPIGIAGVMGGENSEVSPETTEILLESAWFAGTSILLTSKKLGLRSEASLRFEKGVDPNRVLPALDRAASLIAQLGGGKPAYGPARHQVRTFADKRVSVTLSRINQVLGTSFSAEYVGDIFRRLGFAHETDGERFTVTVPTRRSDVGIEADLVEEVARIAGYDQIPTALPVGEAAPGGLTPSQELRRKIKHLLTGMGYFQTITYSLTHPGSDGLFAPIGGKKEPIPVLLPMSEDRSRLRTNLLPSLLEVARYNANRDLEDLALFEMSKVFHAKELPLKEQPEEKFYLAGLAMGRIAPPDWRGQNRPVDFYDVKGVLEALFELLGVEQVQYEADAIRGLHPGRGAWIAVNGRKIGYLGQVHPEVAKRYDLSSCYVFQLELDPLLERGKAPIAYQPLPRFPAVARDLAVVVDEAVPAGALLKSIRESGGEWLEEAGIFDVYQGGNIEKGKKSIAFSMVFRHPERTLNDEEVNWQMERILKNLSEKFGAALRS